MTTTEAVETATRRSKKPVLIGVALAAALGGGGFYAVQSGLVAGLTGGSATAGLVTPLADVVFVPLDPLVISLGQNARNRHLRFRAQLEVDAARRAEVEALLPRVLDVLNGYLRAVEVAELENPAALIRLRAQMLRRIQIVTGEGRVRDLLVMEFVLN